MSLFSLSKGLTVLRQDRYCPSKNLGAWQLPPSIGSISPGTSKLCCAAGHFAEGAAHPETYFTLPKPQLPATPVGSCFSETQLCPSRVRHHRVLRRLQKMKSPRSSHSAAAATAPHPSHRSSSGPCGFPLLQEDPRQNFSSLGDGFSECKKQDSPRASSNEQPDATCGEALPLRRGPRAARAAGLTWLPSLRPG